MPELCDPRYELLQCVGQGAIATVWTARDRKADRIVAIKLMHVQAIGLEAVQRMALEAKILVDLRHPHIIRVLEPVSLPIVVPMLSWNGSAAETCAS